VEVGFHSPTTAPMMAATIVATTPAAAIHCDVVILLIMQLRRTSDRIVVLKLHRTQSARLPGRRVASSPGFDPARPLPLLLGISRMITSFIMRESSMATLAKARLPLSRSFSEGLAKPPKFFVFANPMMGPGWSKADIVQQSKLFHYPIRHLFQGGGSAQRCGHPAAIDEFVGRPILVRL
jgi:hypothetical protein